MEYEAAERSFDAGDYAGAARSYDAYLNTNTPDNRDRALFRAGLAYALAGEVAENALHARTLFHDLVMQFPNSPYRVPVNLILSLEIGIDNLKGNLREQEAKIKTLADELRRLKEIDMNRRPSRTPP